jgi:hypothetical protein
MASLDEFEPQDHEASSDTDSDISKEDANVTTALIGTRAPLGDPEVRRGFWFSKVKPNDPNAIATQVCVACPLALS